MRAAHPGELIAVFSHADVVKLLTAYYIGLPLDLFQRLVISPASITEISFGTYGAGMLRCNDCAHVPPEPAEAGGQSLSEAQEERREASEVHAEAAMKP